MSQMPLLYPIPLLTLFVYLILWLLCYVYAQEKFIWQDNKVYLI